MYKACQHSGGAQAAAPGPSDWQGVVSQSGVHRSLSKVVGDLWDGLLVRRVWTPEQSEPLTASSCIFPSRVFLSRSDGSACLRRDLQGGGYKRTGVAVLTYLLIFPRSFVRINLMMNICSTCHDPALHSPVGFCSVCFCTCAEMQTWMKCKRRKII